MLNKLKYLKSLLAGIRGGLAVGPAFKFKLRSLRFPLTLGLVLGPAWGYGSSTKYSIGSDPANINTEE